LCKNTSVMLKYHVRTYYGFKVKMRGILGVNKEMKSIARSNLNFDQILMLV